LKAGEQSIQLTAYSKPVVRFLGMGLLQAGVIETQRLTCEAR
jgi:hypothetical protein